MYEILSNSYEFLSEFIPFLAVLILLKRAQKKDSVSIGRSHYILPIVFALYIIAVFYVTGAGTIYDAVTVRFEELKYHMNLIPFSRQINTVGYLLNIVMFVPLGFLVPLLWKKARNLFSVLLAGLSFSLLIELSQLLSCRGTDVDDLIMNTLGAAAGYLIFRLWDKLTASKYPPFGISAAELPVYILTIYLGRCLLFNRMGLIHLMYG